MLCFLKLCTLLSPDFPNKIDFIKIGLIDNDKFVLIIKNFYPLIVRAFFSLLFFLLDILLCSLHIVSISVFFGSFSQVSFLFLQFLSFLSSVLCNGYANGSLDKLFFRIWLDVQDPIRKLSTLDLLLSYLKQKFPQICLNVTHGEKVEQNYIVKLQALRLIHCQTKHALHELR